MNKLLLNKIACTCVSFIVSILIFSNFALSQSNIFEPDSKFFENLPFKMDAIKSPQFPNRVVSIVDFGAKGDGIFDNTEAINSAIKNISQQGGGTVVIPAGIWLTAPIQLLDNVNLNTEDNALVIFDSNHKRYPIIETSFEGLNTRRSTSPIWAKGAKNIAITGNGIFDGSGDAWRMVKKNKMTSSQWKKLLASGGITNESGDTWYPSEESYRGSKTSDMFNNPQNLTTDAEWENIHHWLRPVMLSFIDCRNVLIDGVTFRNSPAWCLHPLLCNDLIINNVKVFNPWYSQNGDALDVESCNRVLISNCLFDAGDDGICLKSGKDKDGRDRNAPCQNLIAVHNTILHAHGGFVVGSEMSGGVKNIYVADCTFLGSDVGLRFKSTRGRGGVVENIWIERIRMMNIPTEPLLFNLYYGGKAATDMIDGESDIESEKLVPVTEETPSFRNIYIKDITCVNARRAMFFNGLPEMKIKNINIENMLVTSEIGAEIVNADGVSLKNVNVIPKKGEKYIIKKSSNVIIDGVEQK